MSLRTVTIWMTGVVLVGTAVVPSSPMLFAPNLNFTNFISHIVGNCVYTGWPLVVSLFIAKKLKYHIPAIILLVSTIAYGILYAFSVYLIFKSPCPYMAIILFTISIWSLPVTYPAWAIARALDEYYYGLEALNPGTAAKD